ncbi:hypothetical protein PG999_010946 [Apiospora kogelbergensis]|uniref:Uncharacterized protein n=1 Tax=Apiospora kogelbergensis TaxID=1337665 RepID=A0AAW0QJA3_9PEZI
MSRMKRKQCSASNLLLLFTLGGTASAALSLADFQLIASNAIPSNCIAAYNSPIVGCSKRDFRSGRQCSADCRGGCRPQDAAGRASAGDDAYRDRTTHRNATTAATLTTTSTRASNASRTTRTSRATSTARTDRGTAKTTAASATIDGNRVSTHSADDVENQHIAADDGKSHSDHPAYQNHVDSTTYNSHLCSQCTADDKYRVE